MGGSRAGLGFGGVYFVPGVSGMFARPGQRRFGSGRVVMMVFVI